MTVNFAIDMRASCWIRTRDDGRIVLESRDRQVSFETHLAAIEDLARERRLELVSKLVHFFKPTTGFHLIAESQAPAGAGLAGSSALNIACIGALNRLVGNRYDERKFVTIAANVETTVIRVPAGFQDYYPAIHGGTSCIHFRPDGIEREALKTDENMLEERIVICYTGEPRLSGTNNWEIFKRHIDGDAELFGLFDDIRRSSQRMREALLVNDWQSVSETMKAAYPGRKRLAPGVTTPQMDALVEKAIKHGAEAAKVCGAGGGGCIAFFCAEGHKAAVARALGEEEGVEVLDWKIAREGLTISETEE
jgi:D-glycero-alpha-D-manno-heptose-7-phosphate kinase